MDYGDDDLNLNMTQNQAMLSILDQLALMDVPQTRTNPNPERPLLRIGHSEMWGRAGREIDSNSRF